MPIPTPTSSGAPVRGRRLSTSDRAVVASDPRAPVTPYVETQYTNPRDAFATRSRRSFVVPGAARNTVANSGGAAASQPSASSTGRSGMIAPETVPPTASRNRLNPSASTGLR